MSRTSKATALSRNDHHLILNQKIAEALLTKSTEVIKRLIEPFKDFPILWQHHILKAAESDQWGVAGILFNYAAANISVEIISQLYELALQKNKFSFAQTLLPYIHENKKNKLFLPAVLQQQSDLVATLLRQQVALPNTPQERYALGEAIIASARKNGVQSVMVFIQHKKVPLSIVEELYDCAKKQNHTDVVKLLERMYPSLIPAITMNVIENSDTTQIILWSYHDAQKSFDAFKSGEKNTLGIADGLLSRWRHSSDEPTTTFPELRKRANTSKWSVFNYCVERLTFCGSLYDSAKADNHSFTNFFLLSLRQRAVPLYRRMVGAAYGIQFIEGKITLYRRDGRPIELIFEEGFQLKETERNAAAARKVQYSEPVTYDAGVSFSLHVPPNHYGDADSYYVVKLPENHSALLVDIVHSPKNRKQLTQYQKNLAEVNAMDGISSCFVHSQVSFFGSQKREVANHHFSSVVVPSDATILHGVF